MKRWLKFIVFPLLLLGFLAALLFATPVSATNPIDVETCSYQSKNLYGKVKIVESFPDFKVQVVNAFPDLKVKPVNAFPDKCGCWQFVEAFPDIKIQFVDAFPDIKIQFVDAFPGLP